MSKSRNISISTFLISDIIASAIVWVIVALLRKHLLHEEPETLYALFFEDNFFPVTVIVVPLFWLALYTVIGSYNGSVYKKSRLAELTTTFIEAFMGSLILLFVLFLNDREQHYSYFYTCFFFFAFFTNHYYLYRQIFYH